MGTLLSLLGSIGIISSGAGSAASAANTANVTIGFWDYVVGMKNILTNPNLLNETYALYNAAMGQLGTLFNLLKTFQWSNFYNELSSLGMTTKNLLIYAKNIAQRIDQLIPDAFLSLENLSGVELAEIEGIIAGSTSTAVEGGILAGSLGTALETMGISLIIGAAVYGGYYAYEHWDSIKHLPVKQ
ncbi:MULTISPECIES: hypothetical protein [Spiroplasma]|uniref:hypothetical protein n=1 Tax=Spiroplasma TaxID=2132 RepID=UPI0018DBEFD3|nr:MULTISPECIES: hypothetical protein [Spiroplasma]MBH8622748.1 hypothetical protein [Spiroplasma sp. hyd1]UNF61793.1 hypothetical protein MNU24_07735 [Spiroplasma poulsonii]